MIAELLIIDLRLEGADPERAGIAHKVGETCGLDQRLARDRPGIDAAAANAAALDQDDARPDLEGLGSNREAAGAAADDAKVGSEDFGHAASLASRRVRASPGGIAELPTGGAPCKRGARSCPRRAGPAFVDLTAVLAYKPASLAAPVMGAGHICFT